MTSRSPVALSDSPPPTRWQRVRRAVTLDCVVNAWIHAGVGGVAAVIGAYALRGTPGDATAEFLRRGGWWAVGRAVLGLLPITLAWQIALATGRAWRAPASSSRDA